MLLDGAERMAPYGMAVIINNSSFVRNKKVSVYSYMGEGI
jgi:hypothetical protein